MTENNEIQWVHCNACLRRTRHESIATRVVNETEYVEFGSSEDKETYPADWETTYTMLECRGCGSVTLRRRAVTDDLGGHDTTEHYPPPISRQAPAWRFGLPKELWPLMREVYAALHAGSKCLALMGARALVDLFMNAKTGDIGGFQKKLDKLVEDGYLSKRNEKILDAALDAGHAAAHRAHTPSTDDVNVVFDIVENLLQSLVLEKRVEALRKHTPKRSGPTTPCA